MREKTARIKLEDGVFFFENFGGEQFEIDAKLTLIPTLGEEKTFDFFRKLFDRSLSDILILTNAPHLQPRRRTPEEHAQVKAQK